MVKQLGTRDSAEKSGGRQNLQNAAKNAPDGIFSRDSRRPESKLPGDDNTIVERPPQTRALSFSVEEKDGLKESIAKLESSLGPDELQVFYTDLLLKDWIIFRDNLTEGVGWNGIFLQIDDKQRRLAIFTVVKEIGATSVELLSTRISIIKVEEI